MDRRDGIYKKSLQEQDLEGLAELCGNVAKSSAADHRQSDTAQRLRAEWVKLNVRFRNDNNEAAEESLRTRMLEFLTGIPGWMMSGV